MNLHPQARIGNKKTNTSLLQMVGMSEEVYIVQLGSVWVARHQLEKSEENTTKTDRQVGQGLVKAW